jgi:hypothetical protein
MDLAYENKCLAKKPFFLDLRANLEALTDDSTIADLTQIVIKIYSKDSTGAHFLGLPSPKVLHSQTYDFVKGKIIEYYNSGIKTIHRIETRRKKEKEREAEAERREMAERISMEEYYRLLDQHYNSLGWE